MSARMKLLAGWAAYSGEDFLHEAINDAIKTDKDGRCIRRIPPETPLEAAFSMVLRSIVSHLYQSKGRRAIAAVEVCQGGNSDAGSVDVVVPMWEADRMTTEEMESAIVRTDAFIAFARTDHIVHGMLMLIRNEGLDKPASLVAERLKVTEAEIYLARKRIGPLLTRFTKSGGLAA